MPFKPSLVALPVDPTAAPYLGYPLTEIVLEQPNLVEGAAIPALPTPDSRDKITEAVTGSDVRVNRRKLSEVAMDIDFISADKKAEIERLYHDARSVYLSPNFGPDTMWSFPLQRSTEDFTGNKTMSTVRNNENHEWDAIDKVFRSFAINEPSIVFHGAWSRYFRSHSAYRNYATKPHPDSVSTGWTISTGAPVITYDENIKTPLLSNRGVVNAEGITLVDVPVGVISTIKHVSTASLSTTDSVCASVCMAWSGIMAVSLQDVGGGTVYASKTITGDGTFQLIRFSGANSNATNDAELSIIFLNSTTKNQMAMLGPIFIGSGGADSTGRFPDWSDGAAVTTDITSETDTVENLLMDVSLSFFLRWSDNENGIVQIGGTPNIRIVKWGSGHLVVGLTAGNTLFTNIESEFGVSEDDWLHCVVTFGQAGVNLYVNGQAHSLNGTFTPWNPEIYDETLNIGYRSGWTLDDSGLSHVRGDRREWTAKEVLDHYDTYFAPAGRGIIEPMYGKELIIEDMEWEQRPGGDTAQWLGRISLRELGVETAFAPMQRQEDM